MRALQALLYVIATLGCAPFGCTPASSGPEGLSVARPPQAESPDEDPWLCRLGDERCVGTVHETCVPDGEFLAVEREDCGARGQVCVAPPIGASADWPWCVACEPGIGRCEGEAALRCRDDGSGWEEATECDVAAGLVCRNGTCVDACEQALLERSNLGCEYWAVDLDNVSIDAGEDAAAQQFAVTISNPFDVEVAVEVFRSDAAWSEPAREVLVERISLAAREIAILPLDQREVDGTPEHSHGWQGRSSGSALSAAAYRIRTSHPVVAYQLNPLANVGVFSNDASLLLPTSALDERYVVIGWPQTVADTDDPETDMGDDYRSFVTVVGTQDSVVTITPSTSALPVPQLGGEPIEARRPLEVALGPYEVLNLETDGLLSDLTGTVIEASAPVAVFSGSEAADVPAVARRADRFCCADHLEEQLLPTSALGTRYAGVRTPSRTAAVRAAGGDVAVVVESEWFRVVAVDPGETHVTTTLPAPDDRFVLEGVGAHATIRAEEDFVLESDRRVAFGQFVGSQETTGIPAGLPGGDPAFVAVPPMSQWRSDYVVLAPSGYAFDFLVIVAPQSASVLLGGAPLPDTCERSALGDSDDDVLRCQLSFPEIRTPNPRRPPEIHPGSQGDGARRIESDIEIGVLLYGFDEFVSYAYAGGTEALRIE